MFRTVGLVVAFVTPLSWPFAADAQQRVKVPRVALVFTTSPVAEMAGPEPIHPYAGAFVRGLRELGYVEGQNLVIERRSAEGKFERIPDILAELVRLKVDVIVTVGSPMALAAKRATSTIPIVMADRPSPSRPGSWRAWRGRAGTSPGSQSGSTPRSTARTCNCSKKPSPTAHAWSFSTTASLGTGPRPPAPRAGSWRPPHGSSR